MTINFTIYGNHENEAGNPIPKLKMTRGQQWTPQAQRYARWKEYVQNCFYEATKTAKKEGKPIEGVPRARMELKIYWANRKHADPESIFGSIADSLFQSDKELDGLFETQLAEDGKGRVEVKIQIFKENGTGKNMR